MISKIKIIKNVSILLIFLIFNVLIIVVSLKVEPKHTIYSCIRLLIEIK